MLKAVDLTVQSYQLPSNFLYLLPSRISIGGKFCVEFFMGHPHAQYYATNSTT